MRYNATDWMSDEMSSSQVLAIERDWKKLQSNGYTIQDWEPWFDNDAKGRLCLIEKMDKGEAAQVITILRGLNEFFAARLDIRESLVRIDQPTSADYE